MISTTCPGCSAKFQVPEDLVTGKTVRFRCRKCGGAIEVDGTKQETPPGATAPAAPPKSDPPGRKRTATLVYGADSSGPAKAPAPPAPPPEGSALPPRVEPVAASKAPMFDLALTPPPPNTDDLWDLPPEALTVKPQKVVVAEAETKPARIGATKKDTPKPESALAEAPKPPVSADAAKPETSKPASPPPSKPGDIAKRPSKAPVQSSPASVRRAFGLDASKDKTGPSSDKSPPASNKSAPASDKQPASEKQPSSDKKPAAAASSDEAPGSGPEAKPARPRPLFADRKSDATMGKRTRGAMELGGVFTAKDEKKSGAEEGDLDVEIDLEDKLDLKPLVIGGADKLKPPPAPQLKKVVLDMSDVGSNTAPESKSLPSVAFFSPVLIQQAALAAPVPDAEPTEEEKHEKQKTSKAMIWAAIIAGVGVLAAGGIVLWATLGGREPAPSRTGAVTETATAAPTMPPPQTGVRTAEPAATAAPAATPETAAAASASPAADTAKPAEPASKATTDTKEPAAGTKKPEPTEGKTAAAAPAEPAKTEPAKAEPAKAEPAKQPQPAEASNDIPFDKAAAAAALASRKGAAAGCKQEGGPTGHAKVSVTFAPSGRVTSANIMGPPFAGTPVGGCIASKFRGATVPPFSGPPVTVSTSVAIF